MIHAAGRCAIAEPYARGLTNWQVTTIARRVDHGAQNK